ncbi:MAG: hypothetical protein RDV48_29650 [Candidatus Eremiobacteraeota bacterium]|nr:hypothetical protein [Candidatus Eremiobacteraeota bacterium]
MKSYSVFYLRDKTPEELERLAGGERKLRLMLGQVNVHPGSPWLECSFHRDAGPPHDEALFGEASVIREQSRAFGEMIFLYCSKPDWFYYEHARDGVLLRRLTWLPFLDGFDTPGWISVEGEPEPWERDFFFQEKKLEWAIRKARDIYACEKDFDLSAHEAGIRRIWEHGRIEARNALPECDWTVAMHVEEVFGLRHLADPWKPA